MTLKDLKVRTIALNMSGVISNSGIERYGIELFQGLKKIDSGNKYMLFKNFKSDSHNQSISNKLKKTLFDQVILPFKIKTCKINLLHSVKDLGLPFKIPSCKYVLTVYDIIPLLFPEIYLRKKLKRKMFEQRLKLCLKRADIIIAISENTKKDIIKHFGLTEGKIEVVPLGVSNIFKRLHDETVEKTLNKFSIFRPYILGIGASEVRKNNVNLIKAFYELKIKFRIGHKLIIVGKDRSKEEFDKFLNTLSVEMNVLKDDIIFCKEVSDEELACLYNGADLFVFLSMYEGFGLPLLEAMACGVPVITSNSSSIPEVIGDAAIMVDPRDMSGIVESVNKLINDRKVRDDLIVKGYNRTQQFSWQNTVKKTADVYSKLLM